VKHIFGAQTKFSVKPEKTCLKELKRSFYRKQEKIKSNYDDDDDDGDDDDDDNNNNNTANTISLLSSFNIYIQNHGITKFVFCISVIYFERTELCQSNQS
jgi:hypothetical protein